MNGPVTPRSEAFSRIRIWRDCEIHLELHIPIHNAIRARNATLNGARPFARKAADFPF
jgi:hypothetical protein